MGEAALQPGGRAKYLYKIISGGRVAVSEAQKARAVEQGDNAASLLCHVE